MWVEQSAKETIGVAKSLKADSLSRTSTDIYCQQQEKRKELFNTWQQQVEDEVGELVLEIDKDQEVFSFNTSGKLRLSFSTRWEILLREVRQVSALGLNVSSRIQQQCAKAAKFYRAGVSLQQVAHFYNNIGRVAKL